MPSNTTPMKLPIMSKLQDGSAQRGRIRGGRECNGGTWGKPPLQSCASAALYCRLLAAGSWVFTSRSLRRHQSLQIANTFSDALDDDRNALADADAHGAQGITAAAALQLIHRGGNQACAAHAERMAECNRAAIRIDARIVVGDAQFTQHRDALRGKRFVELDDIHLIDGQADLLQQLFAGRCRADAHDAWRHAGSGHTDD